jgi:hypothetical protein
VSSRSRSRPPRASARSVHGSTVHPPAGGSSGGRAFSRAGTDLDATPAAVARIRVVLLGLSRSRTATYATPVRQSIQPAARRSAGGMVATDSVSAPPPRPRSRTGRRASSAASAAVAARGRTGAPPNASMAASGVRSDRSTSVRMERLPGSSASNRCSREVVSSQYRTAPPNSARAVGTGRGLAAAPGLAAPAVGSGAVGAVGGTAGPRITSTGVSPIFSVASQRDPLRSSSPGSSRRGAATVNSSAT